MFWTSATFWQVMLCVVIWTLEKHRRRGNLGGHVSWLGWARSEGHVPEKAPAKRRTCLSVGGEGLRYRNHPAQEEFQRRLAVWEILFPYFTPGKTQQPAAEGPSTKHKRNSFYPRSPVPLEPAPSLLWFLFLQLTVSKPLPGIVQALPE